MYNRVRQMDVGKYPNARPVFVPMACRHCADPDCVKVCPTGATYKRDDGLVLIDADKCIGCRACVAACPYGSRTFVEETGPYYPGQQASPYEAVFSGRHQPGTVEKCDFCAHRIQQGRRPACVDTCPALARSFGDLDDPDSPPSQQLAKYRTDPPDDGTGLGPSVVYIRSRKD